MGQLQFHRFLFPCEVDAGLRENPCFDPRVPHPQQIKRPLPVVLFCRGARLMPHDLRDDADGALDPFRQRAETAAQSMQRKVINAGDAQRAVMLEAGFLQPARCCGPRRENPRRRLPLGCSAIVARWSFLTVGGVSLRRLRSRKSDAT